ncbi:hypothetical protein MP228_006243 [Amoeboaphelidium protococcarum]|nr:hypothetical protein MP228_006243 [Amoeboaphelidium protococcarum]
MLARTVLRGRGVQTVLAQQRANITFFNYGNVGVQVLRRKDKEHVHHTDPGHDAEVWKKPEMVGPGAQSDYVPTQMDQATGKERLQYLALREGKDPFFGLMDQLDGRKGTKENPIEVLSPDDDRIIGCQGPQGHRHEINWMMVYEDGHKYWEYGHNRCPECGNTFKLKKIQLPYQSIC